jgi:NAD(P)-dependent dehydrogenase (short-subunit alcohol dehydrogenase family)
MTDAASVSQIVAQAGSHPDGLHILLINPLAAPQIAAFEEQTDELLASAFAGVRAAAAAMRAALPSLRAAGCGRIVIVGHRYGLTVNDGIAAYNAAAWALFGLARSAAIDWGQYQIATNVLIPFANTPELQHYRERRTRLIDTMIGQLPLRRAGDPLEDIGGAAVFLASEAANFVNGETLFADGGQHTAGPVVNPGKLSK